MMDKGLYREVLLDHFRNPRNKGSLEEGMQRERGSNPRCGDDIEVGVVQVESRIEQIRFHGRGCSVCIASASMMTEACEGAPSDSAISLCNHVESWVGSREGGTVPHPGVEALDGARAHAARHTCILLSWRALCRLLTADAA